MRIIFLLLIVPMLYGEEKSRDFFTHKVEPILKKNCYQCHSHSKKIKGGLTMETGGSLLKGGDSGAAIHPGRPELSLLSKVISWKDPDMQMPPKRKLSKGDIAIINQWISDGAKDPREVIQLKEKNEKNDLWSFQRLKDVKVPAVDEDLYSVNNEIDNFIISKLISEGLSPSKQADKITEIRRLSYNIRGIPPTWEETKEYLNDKRKNAFELLVDRYLESDLYGERWARYWLDLSKYADTKGHIYSGMEKRYIHSHLYRDWVINAFNNDLPYNDFLKLQIAGDTFAKNKKDLAAMGFLTLGPWNLGYKPTIIDDQLDTLFRTTQGLTISCARCHDHKYDPISIKDYYSMYGIFSNSGIRRAKLKDELKDEKIISYKKRLEKLISKSLDKQAVSIRKNISKYLAAQENLDDLPSEEIYFILKPGTFVPAFARRWKTYLDSQKSSPVWRAWFLYSNLPRAKFTSKSAEVLAKLKSESAELNNKLVLESIETPPKNLKELASIYGKLLNNITEKAVEGEDPAISALREVMFGKSSPCRPDNAPVHEIYMYLIETDNVAIRKLEGEFERYLLKQKKPSHTNILKDRDIITKQHVFLRGNPSNEGEVTVPGFLSQLGGAKFVKGSGRSELAEAIASENNPLTARVMVNRVWKNHFGQGLVNTSSDFGFQGSPPSHPELLDWLAKYFMDNSWSLKKLHKLILTSSTWRQRSEITGSLHKKDPQNLFWGRQNKRRLDFESLRDSLLQISGELNLTSGGKSVQMFDSAFSKRRTIYGYIDRLRYPSELISFDVPSPDTHNSNRFETIVPQQALSLLNGEFIGPRVRAISKSVEGTEKNKVIHLYRKIFQREPTSEELLMGVNWLKNDNPPSKAEGESTDALNILEQYVQVLLLTNEFIYID